MRGISPDHTLAAAERLRAFDRPALIAWGTRDRFFPLRDAVLHAQSAPRRLPDIGTNESRTLLRVLDETLWFNEAAATPFVCATSRPTIADIACFVPVALLDEAEIESIDYPAFRRWSRRLKRLDGFTTMAGVYAAV